MPDRSRIGPTRREAILRAEPERPKASFDGAQALPRLSAVSNPISANASGASSDIPGRAPAGDDLVDASPTISSNFPADCDSMAHEGVLGSHPFSQQANCGPRIETDHGGLARSVMRVPTPFCTYASGNA